MVCDWRGRPRPGITDNRVTQNGLAKFDFNQLQKGFPKQEIKLNNVVDPKKLASSVSRSKSA